MARPTTILVLVGVLIACGGIASAQRTAPGKDDDADPKNRVMVKERDYANNPVVRDAGNVQAVAAARVKALVPTMLAGRARQSLDGSTRRFADASLTEVRATYGDASTGILRMKLVDPGGFPQTGSNFRPIPEVGSREVTDVAVTEGLEIAGFPAVLHVADLELGELSIKLGSRMRLTLQMQSEDVDELLPDIANEIDLRSLANLEKATSPGPR